MNLSLDWGKSGGYIRSPPILGNRFRPFKKDCSMSDIASVLGMIAGICTTLAFVPQVVKIYKTRKTEDISLAMFLVFCTGLVLWLIYGILQADIPIILANGVTLVLAGYILCFKLFVRDSSETSQGHS